MKEQKTTLAVKVNYDVVERVKHRKDGYS